MTEQEAADQFVNDPEKLAKVADFLKLRDELYPNPADRNDAENMESARCILALLAPVPEEERGWAAI